jgi:hypothetical protein
VQSSLPIRGAPLFRDRCSPVYLRVSRRATYAWGPSERIASIRADRNDHSAIPHDRTALGSAGFGHDVIDQLIGVRRDDCESAYPLARSSVFPVLPNAAETKRPTILHGDCVRLFGFLPLDCHPFEEPVHRNDALPTPMQAPVRHGSSPPDATGICPPASANSCRRLSLTRRVFNSLIPCSQTPPANEPA